MLIAITRAVSDSLAQCELTHLSREKIDVVRATAQHEKYEQALRELGVRVVRAVTAPELPDSVFVEDAAVVVEELVVITRPGAASRRAETAGVAEVLGKYRRLVPMTSPGTLDGGDVLRVGKTIYVGRSSRTNEEGIRQLAAAVGPHGYRVEGMAVSGCLHLKSAVTQVGENLLLVNPAWLPAGAFAGVERIEVDPGEPYAANALRIGATLIYPAHFPRTRERLESRGFRVKTVECDELAKAEGAVTCCSIILDHVAE